MKPSKEIKMKRLTYVLTALLITTFITACQNGSKNNSTPQDSTIVIEDTLQDSTVYGKVVDGGMSTLILLTDAGDSIEYVLENELGETVGVKGGYNIGDRLAVVSYKNSGENIVRQAINLLSLQGQWTSIDRNFIIEEGGVVKSEGQAEKNPWTNWKILNGKLMLNRQAFDIDELSADTLAIEDSTGIYVFKRQK